MKTGLTPVHILVIDDEEDLLDQVKEFFDGKVFDDQFDLIIETCLSFDDGLRRAKSIRYDIVIADIWLGSRRREPDDNRGYEVISAIREARFCPVIAYSTSGKPASLPNSPFIRFADKASGFEPLEQAIRDMLVTGVPLVARSLHKDLDLGGANFLWKFLAEQWDGIKPALAANPVLLDRLVRKRASVLFGRLDSATESPFERESVQAMEYYIYPPISPSTEIRLGDVLKETTTGSFRVVLTPHCHLVTQAGKAKPKAELVLVTEAQTATEAMDAAFSWKDKVAGKSLSHWEGDKKRKLSQRINLPAQDLGLPEGRYVFLPEFLEIPNMFCDLLAVKSIPMDELLKTHTRIATIDTPFAEALQSTFLRLFSGIGLPLLEVDHFLNLLPPAGAAPAPPVASAPPSK